jgi:hypothetical protein
VRVGEPGAFGRDQEIAVERDLEATGNGDAVDRADERLGVRRERAAERQPAVVAPLPHVGEAFALLHLPGAEFLQVDARAERRVGAGEDHHVDGVVGVALLDRGRQRLAHRAVERVARLGPVQRNDRDPVGDVDQDDAVVSHGSRTPP